ncbi:MAG: hypothetical protein ACFB9M_16530 [Myxococcota bacterium]
MNAGVRAGDVLSGPDIRLAVSLGVLALALYLGTLGHEILAYDSPTILFGHPFIYDAPTPLPILTALPREEPLLVRDFSWWLDNRVFPFESPVGYRLVNVILNGLNTALAFVLLRKLGLNRSIAVAVVILFVCLPVHVEPVIWLMGRKDLLCALFLLLTFLLWQLHHEEASSKHIRRLSYGLSGLTLLLALLSKISAAPAFLVLWLFSATNFGHHPPRQLPRNALRVLPHLVVTFGVVSWYGSVLREVGLFARSESSFSMTHLQTLATLIPVSILESVRHILLPAHLQISYAYPSVDRMPSPLELGIGYALVSSLSVASVWAIWKRTKVGICLMAALVLFSPYLNVVYIGIWVADRYVYLVSLFLLASVAFAVQSWQVLERPLFRRIGTVLVSSYAVFLLVLTVQYQSVWASDVRYWQYCVNLPRSTLEAHNALTRAHLKNAERATTMEARSDAMQAARSAAQGALDEVERRDVKPNEYYLSSDWGAAAKAHYWMANIIEREGGPIEERLRWLYEGYELTPTSRLLTFALHRHYALLALHEPSRRERHIAQSLTFLEQHKALCGNDVQDRVRVKKQYTALLRSFPGAEPTIAASMRRTGIEP